MSKLFASLPTFQIVWANRTMSQWVRAFSQGQRIIHFHQHLATPSPSFELSAMCQVIVLTHEDAQTELMLPYFALKFKPCSPLFMFGRWAKGEPKCEPNEAVWWAWRDSWNTKTVHILGIWAFSLYCRFGNYLWSHVGMQTYICFSFVKDGRGLIANHSIVSPGSWSWADVHCNHNVSTKHDVVPVVIHRNH